MEDRAKVNKRRIEGLIELVKSSQNLLTSVKNFMLEASHLKEIDDEIIVQRRKLKKLSQGSEDQDTEQQKSQSEKKAPDR